MKNNIIIDSNKDPLLANDNLCFLNNKDECIICSQILNKSTDLTLINNLCKCYNATKICEECFLNWVKENNECFICRKKYNISFEDRLNVYNFKNVELTEKLSKVQSNMVVVQINEELPYDLRLLRDRNLFTTCRTFKLWTKYNRCRIFRYTIIYSVLITAVYSIRETIEYNNHVYNDTYRIIL